VGPAAADRDAVRDDVSLLPHLVRPAQRSAYRSGERVEPGDLVGAVADGLTLVASATPAVQVVDDTGAGEILAGAYLALRAHPLAGDRALGYAVRAASSSVTEFGVDGPHLTRELSDIRDEVLAGPR
jgi:sugar/nucleoside kinase (ribokinase family)